VVAAGAALLTAIPALAAAPNPSLGSATVDGNAAEWNLQTDFFSNMIRAGGNGGQTKVESKLYLRYSCATRTLYALVLAEPNVAIIANSPSDQFIKLGNNTKLVDANHGDDGTPPDFAYIGLAGTTATGWEASTQLAPGSYSNLNVHAQVDDGGSQTSAVPGRAIPLAISCNGIQPLTVTKTATPSYSLTYNWAVLKSATPARVTTSADQTTISYNVSVTRTGPIESSFAVTGTITVTNPNDTAATGVDVTDAIVDGPACTVTGGTNATIPAGGSVNFSYRCALATKTDGVNQATATWSGGTSNGQQAFAFGEPSFTSNSSANLSDAFDGGQPEPVTGGQGLTASASFTYTRAVAVPASGCREVPNVATLFTSNEQALPSPATVTVCREVPATPPPATPLPPPVTVSGAPATTTKLQVVKRGPRIARAGTVVTYTIRVRNVGTTTATAVMLTDVLPAGYSFATRPAGATMTKGRLMSNIGDLAAGEAKTLRIRVRIDRNLTGTRCNTAVGSAVNAPRATGRACTGIVRVLGVSVPTVTG
jgi:uncharacterized repeat protein (TIGR01451 family)